MTDVEADSCQDWKNLDGAVAWHLIERHADNWQEVWAMMEAWLRARYSAPNSAAQDKAEALEMARGIERLTATVRYLVGIAERGEGRKIAGNETVEQFVLGYVKKLESRLSNFDPIREAQHGYGQDGVEPPWMK